jgi:hypothetical protein
MCKAPKPPKPKEPKKPQFLRNRYLDEFIGNAQAVKSLKTGRSNLRIPLGGPAPVGGRQPGDSLVPATPTGTSNTPVAPRPNPIAPRNPRPGQPRVHLR